MTLYSKAQEKSQRLSATPPTKHSPALPPSDNRRLSGEEWTLLNPSPSPEGVGPSLPLQGDKVTSKGNIQQAPLI